MRSTSLLALTFAGALACSPLAVNREPAPPRSSPAPIASNKPAPNASLDDVDTLLTRELAQLPELAPVEGHGWNSQIPGRGLKLAAGRLAGSEELEFFFEDSTPVACTVFAGPFDPATYLGNLLDDVKASLEIVSVNPTRFSVEREIPSYFVSIFYRKANQGGVSAGQLKLAMGLHATRPVVCVHDAPGYTETFEQVSRVLFAHYAVPDAKSPLATSISVARVGTLPVGFSRESVRALGPDSSESRSLSAQMVPRSATDLMVSDEDEVVIVSKAQIVDGHFVQLDTRGPRLDLVLKRVGQGRYTVTGSLGDKPLNVSFQVKNGLPSAEATSARLKQELAKNRPFEFTQSEFHAALDPTNPIEVRYRRLSEDAPGVVRVSIGQLEIMTQVDDRGDQIRSEMKAGTQSIVFERMYHRDDRDATPSPTRGSQRRP